MEGQRRDIDRLRAIFNNALRSNGYYARNEEHGIEHIPIDIVLRGGKFVFWHYNDRAAFDAEGMLEKPLRLVHFQKHALEICQLLAEGGFEGRVVVDQNLAGSVIVNPAKHES